MVIRGEYITECIEYWWINQMVNALELNSGNGGKMNEDIIKSVETLWKLEKALVASKQI